MLWATSTVGNREVSRTPSIATQAGRQVGQWFGHCKSNVGKKLVRIIALLVACKKRRANGRVFRVSGPGTLVLDNVLHARSGDILFLYTVRQSGFLSSSWSLC